MFEIISGVPANMLRLIMKIYDNTMAKVTSPGGDSLLLRILAGMMQGDTLAPYLFIIVLDYAIMRRKAGKILASRWSQGEADSTQV